MALAAAGPQADASQRPRGHPQQPSRKTTVLSLCLVAGASALAALGRIAIHSRTLFAWDSVNFALALERLDLVRHQPHPPASIGYVLAGRLLRLATHDSNLALVGWNALLTAVSGILVFALAHDAAKRDKRAHGWLAWAALMASPLVWFYGCVAEVYISEMTLGLLVGWCCLRALAGDRRWAHASVASLAVVGAFRLTTLVFLLPLVVFACRRARASLFRAAALLAGGVALWLVPLFLHSGVDTYLAVLGGQSAWAATAASAFSGDAARNLNRHLRDIAYALVQGLGPWYAVALPAVAMLARPRLLPRRDLVALVALWTLPTLAFYALVHMAKPGYVLLAAPVLALAAAFYVGQFRRSLQVVFATCQVLSGTAFFLLARPASGPLAGEGLRYRQKSFVQKLATEASSLTTATRHAILRSDDELEGVVGEIENACPGQRGAVVVAGDGGGTSWRRLMYYLPKATVVRLPGSDHAAWHVARERAFDVAANARLEVVESCRTFWVLPVESPALTELRSAGLLRERTNEVPWTEGSLAIEVDGGFRLEVRASSYRP